MYGEFFNLKTKPFELVPNPEFLFLSRSHKKAITFLDYGIREKIGFILLTGEIGSGKTTILRNLIKGLQDRVVLSKIFNTKVSSEQLIAMINDDFGLNVVGKDKITLIRELNDFLIEQYAKQNQSILIIDEAQNLCAELLEEIRMLSNLETDKQKLLQIVLVGQPELRKILASPELKQLKQRISISCHIQPLSLEETEAYIYHRLHTAGNRDAVKFNSGTFDTIYKFSKGVPRLINIICDFLMLSAYVEEKRELDLELVKEVVGELETENNYWEDKAFSDAVPINNTILEELTTRMERIEQNINQVVIQKSTVTDLFERLADLEKLIAGSIENSPAESARLKEKLISLSSNVELLNKKTAALEKKGNDNPENKRKGLWNWMAS
ncbi:MAG: hypothetical protein FD174_184 [Geobacteraceae bacterium]|nr:MAG: hypothetical protein FD174_184 [Geobacteraceae bacterium]